MVVVIKTGRCKIQLGRDKRPFYKKRVMKKKQVMEAVVMKRWRL